jgi:hypothetical protein
MADAIHHIPPHAPIVELPRQFGALLALGSDDSRIGGAEKPLLVE